MSRVIPKKRLSLAYSEAMERVADLDDDAACAIDDYVEWLKGQNTNKRKMLQVLRAELDELGGDGSEHRFKGQFHSYQAAADSTPDLPTTERQS